MSTRSARLVRINHERCNEYDGSEYVLAPADWTQERVQEEILAVRDEMIQDAQQIKDSPLAPPHHPPYADHPDLLVRDVQQLHAEQKEGFERWREENAQLIRSLQDRLTERGFVQLWQASDEDVIAVSIDWGHNHGLHLNYKHSEF